MKVSSFCYNSFEVIIVNIVEYKQIYDKEIKSLLVELQEYISSIDPEKYNIITEEYGDRYLAKTLSEVKQYEGKINLAIIDNNIVGLIVGLINNEKQNEYDFIAPKRGRITELIVSKSCRSGGIGKALLISMEGYLKSVGCEGILIDVFATNEIAKNFYYKHGYTDRNIEMMKKI